MGPHRAPQGELLGHKRAALLCPSPSHLRSPIPNFLLLGAAGVSVSIHPSLPGANAPSFAGLCLVYLSNKWLSSVLVWFSEFLSYPPRPECGAMDGSPK